MSLLSCPIAQRRMLAAAVLLFLTAASVPFYWLATHFSYPDVLHQPAGQILQRFHAGGPILVLVWFAFALSALLFIPVVMAVHQGLDEHWQMPPAALPLGIAAAIAQCIGLLRWTFVVPALAQGFAAPASGSDQHEILALAFTVQHHFGGVVIGEFVGQTLLAGWTAAACYGMRRSRLVPAWIPYFGLLTIPFWLLGQTELLHQVIPGIAAIQVTALAFMGWELWLLALAICVLRPRPQQAACAITKRFA